MSDEITWDDAIDSGNFITLESDKEKIMTIDGWDWNPVEKFQKKEIEFVGNVIEEDGKKVEKKFTTTSNRLKKKLRPLLEGKPKTDTFKLSVLKVGEKFDTQYSVKLLE